MNGSQRTYAVAAFIPTGKILTYKTLATLAQVSNPRLVGSYLHNNPYPGIVPCHRVINSQGKVAKTFAFGGGNAQLTLLREEGVALVNDRVKLTDYLWHPSPIFLHYFQLLFTYGNPGPWPWFGNGEAFSAEEIVISSILTQNTNWKNVEYALENLRKSQVCSLKGILELAHRDNAHLQQLLKPAGFYTQKSKRLETVSNFILSSYGSLTKFFSLPTQEARTQLLHISGIGKETADTILLYAGNKPVFIIDTYTKRFTQFHALSEITDYDGLQKVYMEALPRQPELFQDYHALIIEWGKRRKQSGKESL